MTGDYFWRTLPQTNVRLWPVTVGRLQMDFSSYEFNPGSYIYLSDRNLFL